jgi:hypothetical protein
MTASTVTAITFGCADPTALAEFYRAATDATVIFSSDTAVYLDLRSGVRLGFDQVPDAARPDWPTGLPRTRLDLTATDLEADERRLRELGATRPGHPYDTDQWIFMADPAGHLFSPATVY